MKKIILPLIALVTSFSAFANEQCLVQGLPQQLKSNTVTSIAFADAKKDHRIFLRGYALSCDNAENHYCVFDAKIDQSRTVYIFGSSKIEVSRNNKNKLTGKGNFLSPEFTHGKSVSLECSDQKPVRH